MWNIFKRFKSLDYDVIELRRENLKQHTSIIKLKGEVSMLNMQAKTPKLGQTWLFDINGQEIQGFIYWANDDYWVCIIPTGGQFELKDLTPLRQV